MKEAPTYFRDYWPHRESKDPSRRGGRWPRTTFAGAGWWWTRQKTADRQPLSSAPASTAQGWCWTADQRPVEWPGAAPAMESASPRCAAAFADAHRANRW